MSILVRCKQTLGISLALALAVPQGAMAQAASNTQIIFPGQPLPADIGYVPLSFGTTEDAELKVQSRDWFLLRDKDQGLMNPTSGKSLDFVGPILAEQNVQLYFRLISGLILKESMVQAGFSANESKHLVESVKTLGQDFNSMPISKMGPLPKGLAELYENWERPMARMAVLPYTLLPLAVAYDQSNFQHFFRGPTEDQARQMSCTNIETVAPLGPIQSKLSETQARMSELDSQLRAATSLKQTSDNEQVRLSGKIKTNSDTITQQLECFNSIRDRVARGATLPTASCLALAKSVMVASGQNIPWEKFVTVNLTNDVGDFTHEKKLDSELTALETRIQTTEQSQRQAQEQYDDMVKQIEDNKVKISGLQGNLETENANLASLALSQEKLAADILKIQDLNHKIETGDFAKEASDAEFKAAVASTSTRNAELQKLKDTQNGMVKSRAGIETNLRSMTTQIAFIQSENDEKAVLVHANDVLLNHKENGINVRLASLRAEQEKLKPLYTAAMDAARFSEYILSLLNKDTAALNQERDQLLAELTQANLDGESYVAQIQVAQKAKDEQFSSLEQSKTNLQNAISPYTGLQNMGWFLEANCLGRKAVTSSSDGIFLSRATIPPVALANTSDAIAIVDGGRWGLFNMDYKRFQAPIQSGILLNLPSYIQTSVQQMIADYDSAMGQYFDTSVKKCGDGATDLAAIPLSVMRAVYASWQNSESVSLACVSPAQKGAADRFNASLSALLKFEGSILDQALPQEGRSQSEDLIERRAIALLASEIGGTTASTDSQARRDNLIKAMIQVLAYDYEGATVQQRTQAENQNQTKYVFATPAPGPAPAADATVLSIGNTYPIRATGAINLYSAPVAKPGYVTGVTLSLNDEVQVVAMDNLTAAEVDGWVRVKSADKIYWMPAWAIRSSGLIGENGQEVAGFVQPSNCPSPRLVTELIHGKVNRFVVSRYTGNLTTVRAGKKAGFWKLDIPNLTKVSPANTKKTYIACETFAVPGQQAMVNVSPELQNQNGIDFSSVQAIRLIEVNPIKTANGTVIYTPIEAEGGFVPTWALENLSRPRIVIGAELDPNTWSLVR